MTDLSLYEFGDVAWDEFCQSKDHIVPHPIDEEASEQAFLGNNLKEPRYELIGVLGIAREQSANYTSFQGRNQGIISVLNNARNTMLEKNSWLRTPDVVFPPSCDCNSAKEVSALVTDDTTMSSHCFDSNNTDMLGNDFYTTDSILIEKSAAIDSNSYNYPLDPMPQTDNDLSFFDNDHDDKNASDFLCYGWPDIGDLEDVDTMFRSCDSTFGLGASNDDELGWFSSSDTVEGSGDLLKSEFKVSLPVSGTVTKDPEKYEPIKTNETRCALDDTSLKNASLSYKNGSWQSGKDECNTLGHVSLVNGTSSSDGKEAIQGVKLKRGQQIISATNHSTTGRSGVTNLHRKQQKHQRPCEAKRKDSFGDSFYYNGSHPTEEKELPSEATSHQTLSLGGSQQQKQALGFDSFGYLQNNTPYVQSDYSYPSDDTLIVPTLSAVKPDTNGFANISPKESYSSNQVLSGESSHGPAIQVATTLPSEKREKLKHQQSFQSSFSSRDKGVGMGVQVPLCGSQPTEKKVQHSEMNSENHTNDDGICGELGSSTGQESSSVSSGLDEISLEAASFHQLQLVMEQLDLRTKLCLRDGLYRLARSAEQRQSHANLRGSYYGDDRDAGRVPLAEGTNKCTGFMDMETGTNPLDRSIAHLLFHRPSDSSVIPARHSSFQSRIPMELDPIEVTKNRFMVLSVGHL